MENCKIKYFTKINGQTYLKSLSANFFYDDNFVLIFDDQNCKNEVRVFSSDKISVKRSGVISYTMPFIRNEETSFNVLSNGFNIPMKIFTKSILFSDGKTEKEITIIYDNLLDGNKDNKISIKIN